MKFLEVIALIFGAALASADDVVSLTNAKFDQHLKDSKYTLVEFYAPWCGHCKKLAPEFEKAAGTLKPKNVVLAKVDATEEKDLASKYGVKGFPTMIWFEEGVQSKYDGGRTADGIVEWVATMTGPAVTETADVPAPTGDKPTLVLHADSLLSGFEGAAKANRRTANFFYKKTSGQKVLLLHKNEEPLEITANCGDRETVNKFLQDNMFPLFGKMDGDTFDKYIAHGKGIVWSMFPNPDKNVEAVQTQHRPMMTEVAKNLKGRYHVTYTDTDKFKEPLESMLSVTEFPAIAVQKKAGDKKKYVHKGEMTAGAISKFIQDVDNGLVEPNRKSESVPPASNDPVVNVVGTTFKDLVFSPTKDVLLEVYAPWCGHCKKLDPEYIKLAKKIKTEEFDDLISIAKIDGTANDSPVDSIDWTGFPTIFFVKAGTQEPMTYEGERTAKGLWKYVKKHATKAQEIRERIEKRQASKRKAEEL